MWSQYFENKKTLDKISDNGINLLFNGNSIGNGGSSVNVNGRADAIFTVKGGKGIINVQKSFVANDVTMTYTIPPLDSDRVRQVFVFTPDGGHETFNIPDGSLAINEALVYDISTNTLTTKLGSWGNISVSENEYILLYNITGQLAGLLIPYCNLGFDNLGIEIKDVPSIYYEGSGPPQAAFLANENIYFCAHTSTDDHTTTSTISLHKKDTFENIGQITHNIGHMNAADYSIIRDAMITANGSKSYTLPPAGWIFKNFSQYGAGSVIDFDTADKVTLDFNQFSDEYKGQLCWGYDDTDIVYLFTCDNRVIRKVLLGKGQNNLGSGIFVSGVAINDYNGSYSILGKWISNTQDILSDMFFYKGNIFTGVKGEYNIRKVILLSNGYFDSIYFPLQKVDGSNIGNVEGLFHDDSFVYAYTAFDGYKVPIEYFS